MGLDLTNDYNKAKTKINAYQTVVENKKNDAQQKKQKAKTSLDKKKSDVIKQLNELDQKSNKFKNQVKNELKNQLEQLLDLFKQTLPPTGGGSLSTISGFFLQAAENTKEQVKSLLVEEIISTIGCSEEQSYEDKLNQPIYIKVSQIDLFKRLKYSPEDDDAKFYYENQSTTPGAIPSSTNRVLYERLQNLGQSYQTQFGSSYKGASGQDLFDIEYVQFYPAVNPTNFGDYLKVTLKPQLNNATSVSDFLTDYYGSIDVLQFDVLSAEIMNMLTGALDYSLKLSGDEMREQKKFELILKRIMGVCTDPRKKIDVGGTAKLSDEDNIDDSFFEVSNQELRSIENDINNTLAGVVEFEDCGNLLLPINVLGTRQILDEVITKKGESGKVDRVQQGIDELANDPNWKNLLPKLGLDLNLKSALDTNLITQLPKTVFKTILSPKVMLGLLVMVKAISSQFGSLLDTQFDDLENFMKTFRKFTVGFMRKIMAIYVKELFDIVKKNVKQLVEKILNDIVKEAKNKQLQMYSSIVYALLVLGQTFIDYRNCKSVIDEILKLLNLALSNIGGNGLPLFALAGSKLLGGISDTRAFANAVEGIQSAGLPTGDAPDGGPNLMNMAFMAMIKGQNKEQAENGKTEVFIPPLTVIVPPFGAGPGITKPSKGFGKSY
jgi:hypothetical protein